LTMLGKARTVADVLMPARRLWRSTCSCPLRLILEPTWWPCSSKRLTVMLALRTRRPLGRVGGPSSAQCLQCRAIADPERHTLRRPRLTRRHLQRWSAPLRHRRKVPTSTSCCLLVGGSAPISHLPSRISLSPFSISLASGGVRHALDFLAPSDSTASCPPGHLQRFRLLCLKKGPLSAAWAPVLRGLPSRRSICSSGPRRSHFCPPRHRRAGLPTDGRCSPG
jgi:hypothetical protein